MKKPLFTTILGAALCGVLLSSSALAAEKIDYAFLKALKQAPAVERNAPDAQPAADTRKAYETRRKALLDLLRSKSFDKAIADGDAMIKDYAAYPGLVRQLRGDLAWHLGRARGDEAHLAASLPYYDALITEKGRCSRDVSNRLRQKLNALDNLERPAVKRDTILRLLAQPDLKEEERLDRIGDLAWTLKSLGDHEGAYALAAAFAADKALDATRRARFAEAAAEICRNGLKDHARPIPLCEATLGLKDIGVEQRARLINSLVRLYDGLKPEPAVDKAHALARSFYQDEKIPARVRHWVISNAYNSHRRAGRKDVLDVYGEEMETYLRENAKELSPREHYLIEFDLYSFRKEYASGTDEFLEIARQVFANTNSTGWRRLDAGFTLADKLKRAGKTDEARAQYRACLPVTEGDVGLVGQAIDELVKLEGEEKSLDQLLALCEEGYRYSAKAGITNRIARIITDLYVRHHKLDEAVAYHLKHGNRLGAIEALDRHSKATGTEKTKALCKELFLDGKASLDDRREAFFTYYGLVKSREETDLFEKHLDFFARGNKDWTNNVLRRLAGPANWRSAWAFYGDFEKLAWGFERYEKIADAAGAPYDFNMVQYSVYAYAALGRYDRAAEVARKGHDRLAPWVFKNKPFMAYRLAIFGDLIDAKGDHAALVRAIAAADKRHGAALPAKERVEGIEHLGDAANLGRREDLVRALADYRKSLYVPAPKKRYVVEFSETPLLGVSDWEKLAKKPVEAVLDRTYGGSMDFLATDVSTGDRGAGIGSAEAKADAPRPTFSAVCDAEGIHLRYVTPDKRARDVQNGLIGAGSYEGYIAPGANEPYVCLLLNPQTTELGLWNTTYDTTGHRRIDEKNLLAYRTQTYYTDDAIVSYVMLSWDNYTSLIPSDGSVWEYENILWGREMRAAWNGTESIHGRSTWGELEFRLPAHARAQILKRQLYKEMKKYNAEKRCSHTYQGCIDLWQDTALGDPAFYEAMVKPLVEKLDAYLPLVKEEMTDEEVFLVADEALPGWRDIRFTVARLRQQWLAKELSRQLEK